MTGARLDTYLENIREIERRIKIAMETTVKEPSEEIPFGLPENKHVHYRLMYDLLALAFEGDLTRSATYMLGKDLSGASFPESGFNGGWHGSSHHGDKPDNVANYAKMNRYHVQNLAYFADKLSKTPDGDGTSSGPHPDLQGKQHGQFASPRACEGADHSARRPGREFQRATVTSYIRTTRSGPLTCCSASFISTESKDRALVPARTRSLYSVL